MTRVGRAVKARREELKLTLRALASLSGISSSMISDVERGEKSPTISTLSILATALGTPISALLDRPIPTTRRIQVVRASKRKSYIDRATGARRQSFGPAIAGSKVRFMCYAVPPHTTAGPFPAHAIGTIEHIHVAAGAVRIAVGDNTVSLKAGDSCSCFANAMHLFDNARGNVEALIYLVIEQR
jgi:transcriptional regulator with XRE-family HTH domain